MKKIKGNKFFLWLLVLIIVFFSSNLVLTWDSTHYLTYVDIFERVRPIASWDLVRGPVFPLILFLADVLFGKSSKGILICMFLFYLVYCYLVYRIVDKLFKNVKYKRLYKIIIYLFCFFNPIILGYYHTMLTEFVAITFTMVSIVVSWKWVDIRKKESRLLYFMFFCVSLTIVYFLKQPYICIVLIPMVLSILIALLKKCTKDRLFYYIGTLVVSLMVLLVSMKVWNKILEYKGVNLNSGRDSGSMLAEQLLNSIDGYQIDRVNKYIKIKNDKFLTKSEKKLIKEYLKNDKYVYIISIYNNQDKILERDVLKVETNGKPSGTNTIFEIVSTFVKHPGLVLESYLKNYCALSSICVITSSDGVMYSVTGELDFVNTFENSTIPYLSFADRESHFYYPDDRQETVKNYLEPVNQSWISSLIEKSFGFTSFVFKFVIGLLFIFLVLLVIFRICWHKKLRDYDMYLFSFYMLSFCFFTLVANAIVGSIIDRYATICFIPALFGILGAIIFFFRNFTTKVNL